MLLLVVFSTALLESFDRSLGVGIFVPHFVPAPFSSCLRFPIPDAVCIDLQTPGTYKSMLYATVGGFYGITSTSGWVRS